MFGSWYTERHLAEVPQIAAAQYAGFPTSSRVLGRRLWILPKLSGVEQFALIHRNPSQEIAIVAAERDSMAFAARLDVETWVLGHRWETSAETALV